MPAGAGRVHHRVEEWCARFEDQCRRHGVRVTPQRLAVYRVLAEDTTHPTADSVYARLRSSMRGLSLATVYRILESLEQEGFVRRVSTTDGIGRFDANMAPHQHLVCRSCGRISDFDHESLRRLEPPRDRLPDFLAEGLDIRIIGRCRQCRRNPEPGRRQGKI
jgi:Fur family peroxide stress response transcriptional regulator